MARKKKIDVDSLNSVVELDLIAVANGEDGYKPQQTAVNEPVVKRNVLNEIMDALFKNKAYIENMTVQQANQNLFMVLRRVAIQYPEQANVFNNKDVNAKDVIKFFSDYLYNGKFTPKWLYTSGASKSQAKASTNKLSKSDINEFVSYYGISMKDFEWAMRIFPDETFVEVTEHINYFKKIQSSKVDED